MINLHQITIDLHVQNLKICNKILIEPVSIMEHVWFKKPQIFLSLIFSQLYILTKVNKTFLLEVSH